MSHCTPKHLDYILLPDLQSLCKLYQYNNYKFEITPKCPHLNFIHQTIPVMRNHPIGHHYIRLTVAAVSRAN